MPFSLFRCADFDRNLSGQGRCKCLFPVHFPALPVKTDNPQKSLISCAENAPDPSSDGNGNSQKLALCTLHTASDPVLPYSALDSCQWSDPYFDPYREKPDPFSDPCRKKVRDQPGGHLQKTASDSRETRHFPLYFLYYFIYYHLITRRSCGSNPFPARAVG